MSSTALHSPSRRLSPPHLAAPRERVALLRGLAVPYYTWSWSQASQAYIAVMPGAFRSSLRSADITSVIDHDDSRVLGSTRTGALALIDEPNGLFFELRIPMASRLTQYVLAAAARPGGIHGCSAAWEYCNGRLHADGTLRASEASLRHVSVCIDDVPVFGGTYVTIEEAAW